MVEVIPYLGKHTTLPFMLANSHRLDSGHHSNPAFKTLEGKELSRVFLVNKIALSLSPSPPVKANSRQDGLGK